METLQLMETLGNHFNGKIISKTVVTFCVPFALLFVLKRLVGFIWPNTKSSKSIKSDLSFLPCPKTLPLIGNVLDIPQESNYFQGVINMAEKYGPIFRMKFLNYNILFVSSASIALQLLKSNKLGHTFKPKQMYRNHLVESYINKGVVVINGQEWRTRRKMLLPTMSKQSHLIYMNYLNNHCKTLVQDLKLLYSDGEPHAPSGLVNGHIVAVTCEMLTGVPIDNIEECTKYHFDFKRYGLTIRKLIFRPWLLLPFVDKVHPLYKERDELVNKLNVFLDQRLNEIYDKRSLHNQTPSEDMEYGMLDTLINNKVSNDEIRDEAKMLLFGGYETVAATMDFVLWCLALNPEHQEVCRKEVDEVFEGILDNSNELTIEAVNKMKYLEMCISETLRMYPVGYMIARSLDEPWEIEYKGEKKVIPKGTMVGLDMLGVHRNSRDNPNPTQFDPSRFSPEKIAQNGPPPFLPFSSGIRGCLGVSFAMVELKMITAHLLRNFRWTTEEQINDTKIKCGINLMPYREINFKFVSRSYVQK